jgi:ribosome-associated protein
LNKINEINEKIQLACKALDDKQAIDIKVLDISGVTVMADVFIIAHGNNENHVQALIDEVDRVLSKEGYEPKNVEGVKSAGWILMDYSDIIIHIFGKDDRVFYDLERIWSDGKVINIETLLANVENE